MNSKEDSIFRLKLAEGYLDEAKQYSDISHFRSCVSSSQLAVENAAKALLELFGPLFKTHDLQEPLLELLGDDRLGESQRPDVKRLAEITKILGFQEHIRTDYGDRLAHRTPWEIYDQTHAEKALALAEEAFTLAKKIIGSLE